jgi:hypothetical protein
MRHVCLSIVLAAAMAISVSADTVLLREDFSSGTQPAGWRLFNGSASFSNGYMNLSYGCIILPGTYDRQDGLSIDVDVNITWGGAGDYNLFAFYDPFQDTIVHCVSAGVVHGYNFGVFPAGSDNPEDFLDSSINGALVVRNTTPASMPANQWFHIRAEIHRDGLVRILLNGHESMRMTNFDHSLGFLVMRSWGDVYIDHVVVAGLGEQCTRPPDLTPPPDVVVPTAPDAASCGVTIPDVALGGGSAFDSCANTAVTVSRSDLPAGNFFPVGTTLITYSATNAAGTSQATQRVTVTDATPPSMTPPSASPAVLWPPNHKMVTVRVGYDATDLCTSATATLSVSSNEPANGLGDGDTAPDWEVLDAHTVRLRAERSGRGNGRVYTITVHAVDQNGNASSRAVEVQVPHEQ